MPYPIGAVRGNKVSTNLVSGEAGDPIGDALRADAALSVQYSGGNFIDPAGSHVLTNHNGATSTSSAYGDAVTLNGTNQWLSTPADVPDLSPNSADFTIITALYLDFLPQNEGEGYFPFIKDNQNGDDEYYLTAKFDVAIGHSVFDFAINGNGEYPDVASSVTPQAEQWQLIFCWYDATEKSINIQVNNGTIDKTTPDMTYAWDGTMPVISATSTFDIGVDSAGGGSPISYLSGKTVVTIIHRLLTTDEKAYLYNSGDGRALYP